MAAYELLGSSTIKCGGKHGTWELVLAVSRCYSSPVLHSLPEQRGSAASRCFRRGQHQGRGRLNRGGERGGATSPSLPSASLPTLPEMGWETTRLVEVDGSDLYTDAAPAGQSAKRRGRCTRAGSLPETSVADPAPARRSRGGSRVPCVGKAGGSCAERPAAQGGCWRTSCPPGARPAAVPLRGRRARWCWPTIRSWKRPLGSRRNSGPGGPCPAYRRQTVRTAPEEAVFTTRLEAVLAAIPLGRPAVPGTVPGTWYLSSRTSREQQQLRATTAPAMEILM